MHELLVYEVWMTQGQGGVCIAKFMSHNDAIAFSDKCNLKGDGSYCIFDASNKSPEYLFGSQQ